MQPWIEIDLEYDRQKLLDIYNDSRPLLNYYRSNNGSGWGSGVQAGIALLEFDRPSTHYMYNPEIDPKFPKPEYIKQLESKFSNYYQVSTYIMSSGWGAHVDSFRNCVVSFEVLNPDNSPLLYYNDDGTVKHEVFHNNKPIMWDTTLLHGSEHCENERVFFQIELGRDNTFEYYKELYEKGTLITC